MIKVIGMLGDIGSGKSFVARQFGYPVFNADKEVNKIYKNNKSCYKKLRNKLPKHIKSYPINKYNKAEKKTEAVKTIESLMIYNLISLRDFIEIYPNPRNRNR